MAHLFVIQRNALTPAKHIQYTNVYIVTVFIPNHLLEISYFSLLLCYGIATMQIKFYKYKISIWNIPFCPHSAQTMDTRIEYFIRNWSIFKTLYIIEINGISSTRSHTTSTLFPFVYFSRHQNKQTSERKRTWTHCERLTSSLINLTPQNHCLL